MVYFLVPSQCWDCHSYRTVVWEEDGSSHRIARSIFSIYICIVCVYPQKVSAARTTTEQMYCHLIDKFLY